MISVSIIVPNYNYARYLKERIRSIQRQTFVSFELIVVDDASTDESAKVLDEIPGDDRLIIQAHSENSGGVYNRRNQIIEEAKGDWLWFAEADDSAHPRFLESLLAIADRETDLGIVHSCIAVIDQAGRLITDRITFDDELQCHLAKDYVSKGYMEAVRLTSGCFLASSSGLLLNRRAVLDVGGYDLRLKMSSDWDLYLRILQKYDIGYCARPLAYYRSHGDSVTKTTDGIVRAMEDAYCVTNAYGALKEDPRVSEQDKTLLAQRLKGRAFDMFVTKSSDMPATHRFVLERLQEVVPDSRASAALTALKQAV